MAVDERHTCRSQRAQISERRGGTRSLCPTRNAHNLNAHAQPIPPRRTQPNAHEGPRHGPTVPWSARGSRPGVSVL
jgi:hypothetical protein